MDDRLTRARLHNHLTYAWWKYLIAAFVCVMGVNVLFDATRYRPPAEKRLAFYVTNGTSRTDLLQQDVWPFLQARCPEQEELTVLNINLLRDDMYSRMQFTTYIGAGEGDLLLLPAGEAERMAGEGTLNEVFVELNPYIERGTIHGEPQTEPIFLFPADALRGLEAYGCDPAGCQLAILRRSSNPDTAAALIGVLQEVYGVDNE